MSVPDNWPRIKLVLDRALTCHGDDREAYLVDACAGDVALRAQIDALLAAQDEAREFLEVPAILQLESPAKPEDLSGQVVGSYRLVSRLGAGGMGEVYLAHDSKLDRPVALKFLSPELAVHQERLRRFHQEARAASSLNHPHIVVVHDFGNLDARPFIVTEFVDGQTLGQRLRHESLTIGEVLEIGVQIAGALAAAHARGLVHRDIKPDNVMVRPDGYVKVLDFGLAKVTLADTSSDPVSARSRTHAGMVMGTPRYMSPEQARGLDLDASSDVWSLGVVLYEMIAGHVPFDGDTPVDTISAILRTSPNPLDREAPHTPAGACAVVMKALRKDRSERYANGEEMLVALRQTMTGLAATQPAARTETCDDADEESVVSPAGERRRVAVLVSLVSEYASLVERLDTHTVEHIITRLRAAAVDTMRRHGGLVNQSIGEEIVSLFGIPAAYEDADLRAVRAALELHARAREIGKTCGTVGDQALRLQSGLHAGSVVAQRLREGPRRYAVTGPPVQTAARFAAAAEPDAILLSPECQRLVGPFVRTETREPVVVHAAAPPLIPHRVLGESGLENRLDAPDRRGLTPYTGRAAEFRALHDTVALAGRNEGRVALIVGEAGSGKSRMLLELRGHSVVSQFRVLSGRCRPSDGMTSYLPFIELLHGAAATKDPDDAADSDAQVAARIRAIESSLEPFFPLYLHLLSIHSQTWPLPRHLKGEHFQAAMLEALAAFFTACSHRQPLVLLLEDWHWADDASRHTLRHLADVIAAYPLMVAVTTRPETGLLPIAERVQRIDLGPLPFAASHAIIQSVLGVERPPDELSRHLHERTGGNPFFLEEMCQGLREAGVVTGRGGRAVIDRSPDLLQLPDSVQAVIRSRLDRLDQAGRDVVRVASVIGREFTRQILRDAAGGGDPSRALERLKEAGIVQQLRVVPDAVYRFKHVLTQEVAYESLLEHQRRALHRAVGLAIEQHGRPADSLELLAHHFSRAEVWNKAIDYGMQAAERATELSQVADALDMLERVQSWLARLPDEPGRREQVADVLLRQERLCETLGMRGRQVQLSAELIALLAPHGASPRLAEAYLRQGDVSTLLKRFDAADRALTTALRMSRELGDAALERSALRSVGLLRWHQGRHEDALAITERALVIDRERTDDLAVAGDLSNLGNILLSMGHIQRGLATLEEALAMPVVAGDPIKRAYILHVIANAHRAQGYLDRALDYLRRADESAQAHRLPIQRSFHLTSIAHIHLQTGRLEESLRLYREAVELSRRARHADGLAQSLRMLGEVLFGIGRSEEALPHLQEAAELFAQLEDREAEAVVRQHVAVVLERTARPDAMAAWKLVRSLAHSAGAARAELAALEGIARVTRSQMGPSGETVRCCEDALALASTLGESAREASLRNTLGVLHWEQGRFVEALAEYEAALSLTRSLGHRVHEGVILNSVGVTLSRLRRYDEARTALEEALTINRKTGERLLEAHSLAALGDVALALARRDVALDHFEAALAIRRSLDDRRGEAWMLHHVARTRLLIGDSAGAERAAAMAAQIAAECGDPALCRACELTDHESTRTSQQLQE
jgi:serine/threonine protein kinase/tetratricopeptide (TPR) repeat protein